MQYPQYYNLYSYYLSVVFILYQDIYISWYKNEISQVNLQSDFDKLMSNKYKNVNYINSGITLTFN